ncbi:MAG: mechanosensitive ion channel family protein [Endomicrobiales bacterium]|nr:mechanosensitive ion channel family protein [Endomicrobiales bacterium]
MKVKLLDTLINYLKTIVLNAPKIFGIILLIAIVHYAAKFILHKVEGYLIEKAKEKGKLPREQEKRIQTITGILNKFIYLSIWFVGFLIILGEIGINIGPILASVGVLGLALSFGAQNLVRDLISGIFMLLENQVRVGDVAIINGTGGLVENINLRTIILRDLAGVVHVFPNGSINTLSNMTKDWSGWVFDIGVAYKENTDKVIDIIKKVGKEMEEDKVFGSKIIEPLEIFGLDKFDDSAIVIKGRLKTLPIEQWNVGREFNKRIKNVFDEKNIEIPFPHRSVYFGEASKPIEVLLKKK